MSEVKKQIETDRLKELQSHQMVYTSFQRKGRTTFWRKKGRRTAKRNTNRYTPNEDELKDHPQKTTH